MKERPILMSAPMVRAILAGTKTQTRRSVNAPGWDPVSGDYTGRSRIGISKDERVGLQAYFEHRETATWHGVACPYGQPGDRLWVRETFAKIDGQTQPWIETDYRATYTCGDRLGDSLGIKKRWTPSIHMPRAASRITLDVTGVRVERLQDISDADARAEGIGRDQCQDWHSVYYYRALWEKINGHGSWDANPWVWVIEFKRLVVSGEGQS